MVMIKEFSKRDLETGTSRKRNQVQARGYVMCAEIALRMCGYTMVGSVVRISVGINVNSSKDIIDCYISVGLRIHADAWQGCRPFDLIHTRPIHLGSRDDYSTGATAGLSLSIVCFRCFSTQNQLYLEKYKPLLTILVDQTYY